MSDYGNSFTIHDVEAIVDVDKIPWWYDPHFNTMHSLIDEVYKMKPILEANNGK